MFFDRLFKQRPAQKAAASLYAGAVAAARRPGFYLDMAVPDTREGRFELYSLHVFLLLDRLNGQGDAARETAQHLIEAMVTGLDDAFHEMAVSHTVVPKRVKKLAAACNGRMQAYAAALASDEPGALEGVLARTLYDAPPEKAAQLAAWVRHARADLSAQALEALLAGEAVWSPL